jgi:hypothetical protein
MAMTRSSRFTSLFILAWACWLTRSACAAVGATTPFVTYEAEAGTLAGGATVVALTAPPTDEFSSPALEASGHAYVQLNGAGQSVTWINNTGIAIRAINVRACIPDSRDGAGITATLDLYVDGKYRQAITLSSTRTWEYESKSNYNGSSRDPGAGHPHVFFDESHAFILGAPVRPGSAISLVEDAANTASFYYVDCVDLEAPPPPLDQPADSLSIVSYGAVANDISVDCTASIQDCVNAAEAQKKSVWIPAGTFYLSSGNSITAANITIEGAGPWYSTIYRNLPHPAKNWGDVFVCTSCVTKDFHVDADARSAQPGDGGATAIQEAGSGWLINNIWVEHELGTWSGGTNGTIENCRINNSWGDGINLNNVHGGSVGNNLTAQNNFIRGCGDDGIAINSTNFNGDTPYHPMNGTRILNNTAVASWWAHNIAVYGGINSLVENNLAADSVKYTGLLVSVFGANGSSLQSAVIQGNTILRGGGNCFNQQQAALSVGTLTEDTPPTAANVVVRSNRIVHSTFGAIGIISGTNLILEDNTITAPGLYGVAIDPVDKRAIGNAVLNNNLLEDLGPNQTAYINYPAPDQFYVGGFGNKGFLIPDPIPNTWTSQDIGVVSVAGGGSCSGSTFTVAGSGSGIEGTSDAFHYVCQEESGDSSIMAQVNEQQVVTDASKAGLMIRNSVGASDVNATIVVMPGDEISFQWRSVPGGPTFHRLVTGIPSPAWIKLERKSDSFTASYSRDGTAWTTLGAERMALPAGADFGLAISSGDEGNLSSAIFTHVTVEDSNVH